MVDRDDEHVAALLHDAALDDEPERLEAVVAAAAIAIDNAQLHAELQARLDELRGSRTRIVEAGDSERRRLERNLHDGAQQRLVSLSLGLRLVANRLTPGSDAEGLLTAARDELAASLQELRELAQGIHPAVLSDHGLAVALESVTARAPVPVELNVELDGRLAAPLEAAAYYLVCEALTNVGKYAGASRATVDVVRDDDGGPRRAGVLADIGQRLAHEVVGGGLKRRRKTPVEVDVELDGDQRARRHRLKRDREPVVAEHRRG